MATCLKNSPEAVFLLVGDGDCHQEMMEILATQADQGRIFHPGKQTGADLADAYAAIDLFAFSSQTETQGMVLAEAMAAGTPVVALDGPGVREILHHGENGILLEADASAHDFSQALLWLLGDEDFSKSCSAKARERRSKSPVGSCMSGSATST